MAKSPRLGTDKTVYGRCLATPRHETGRAGVVVRFDLIDPDTDAVIEVVTRPPEAGDLGDWLATIQTAPILRVCGRFRMRPPFKSSPKGWRMLASTIEIGPRDNGLISDEDDTGRKSVSGTPSTKTLTIGSGTLKPMVRHRDGYAIAFEGHRGSRVYDVIHPVPAMWTASDIAALSGRISRAFSIVLTGYFRPSIVRGTVVTRWGFVVGTMEIHDVRKPLHPRPARPNPVEVVRLPPPAPEPSVADRAPILALSDAERAALNRLGLDRALFQGVIRKTLTGLGCTTLAEVAALTRHQLLTQPGIGEGRVRHTRRALQDRLLWIERRAASKRENPNPATAASRDP
jgi:hypothetical protein